MSPIQEPEFNAFRFVKRSGSMEFFCKRDILGEYIPGIFSNMRSQDPPRAFQLKA